MIVVSDSSPLIALGAVDHLHVVRELYGRVLIPEAVRREILDDPVSRRAGAEQVASADWIEVATVGDVEAVSRLRRDVGEGEAEAIVLALEAGADLLLADDRAARTAAARMGVRVTGVGGVLIEAKSAGVISLVGPVLDSMIRTVGFRLGRDLHDAILSAAGE